MQDTARAELATAAAARDASDFARGIAANVTAERPSDARTARTRDGRRLRVMALAVLDRSVVLDILDGASWEEMAEELMLPTSEVIRRYGPVVERFRNHVTTDLTIDVEGVGPVPYHEMNSGLPSDGDPVGTAEAIDAWLERHLDPWDLRGPSLAARMAP